MKKNIAYLRFNTESKPEMLSIYKECILNKTKNWTVTPNLDFMRFCYKNKDLINVINSATYSTIDGKPILKIAKWLKINDFKERIPGSDLSIDILKMMNENQFSLFLFGGKGGVAELAAKNIKETYPNIKIAGTLCPDFEYEKDKEKSAKYIQQINLAHPDVVLMCTGSPKTEIFIVDNWKSFESSTYLSVGATIDFLAGNVKRAPKWISKIGLEWFYRLIKDFKRLFKRYWKDGCFLIKMWFLCHFNPKKLLEVN